MKGKVKYSRSFVMCCRMLYTRECLSAVAYGCSSMRFSKRIAG